MAKVLEFDQELVQQLIKLRDDEEKKWGEISEIVGVPVGKCMLVYSSGKVAKKDRIKDATPADIKKLRDGDNISWNDISVRCGIPESACRRMYRDAGGEDRGNRIGKGGRYPGGSTKPEGGTAKKAGPGKKTAAAKPAVNLFDGKTDEEVTAMLTGYAIKVANGQGGEELIKVKSVKKVNTAKGSIVLVDADSGSGRTLKLAAISQVSKRKVVA